MKKTPSNVRIKNFKIDSEKIGKNKKSRKKTTLLILIIKHAKPSNKSQWIWINSLWFKDLVRETLKEETSNVSLKTCTLAYINTS